MPPAVEVWSVNHWTAARKFHVPAVIKSLVLSSTPPAHPGLLLIQTQKAFPSDAGEPKHSSPLRLSSKNTEGRKDGGSGHLRLGSRVRGSRVGSGRPLPRQDLIILALFGFQGISLKERSRRIESYPEECGGDLSRGLSGMVKEKAQSLKTGMRVIDSG